MLHQVPTPWEVVDAYAVEPVRVYLEDDGAAVVHLAQHEIVGAYTFDMASPAPVRPMHKKRHNHDNSDPKRSSGAKEDATPGRSSHSATRPESHDPRSAPPAAVIQRAQSHTPSGSSDSSHSSTPKLERVGSALSFFRTHTQTHPRYDQRHRSGSPQSSGDGSLSASGSGSSDGESEPPPRRPSAGRRRDSDKISKSGEYHSSVTTPARPAKKAAAAESPAYRKDDLKRALIFARGELMKQVEASGKNALVLEGWSIAVLRQGPRYRISIEYTGRPAVISYSGRRPTKSIQRLPPFLGVMDEH